MIRFILVYGMNRYIFPHFCHKVLLNSVKYSNWQYCCCDRVLPQGNSILAHCHFKGSEIRAAQIICKFGWGICSTAVLPHSICTYGFCYPLSVQSARHWPCESFKTFFCNLFIQETTVYTQCLVSSEVLLLFPAELAKAQRSQTTSER